MRTIIAMTLVCGFSATTWAAVTNVTSGGALYTSIQAAVDAANNGDTLLVSTGVYKERVVISQKSVSLLGGFWANFLRRTNVAALTCVDAEGSGTGLLVLSNCTVVLEQLMITNGANWYGGGVLVSIGAIVTARQCEVAYNTALGGGGVAVGEGSTFVAVDAPVYFNSAFMGGGFLAVGPGARIVLQGELTDVRDNHATYGGGIYAQSAEVEAFGDADIFRNTAVHQGGGMYLGDGATGMVRGAATVIGTGYGNRATNVIGEGGGVYVKNGRFVLESNAVMYANYATWRGGGIYVTNGEVEINAGRVGYMTAAVSNSAEWGGGLFAVDARVRVWNNAMVRHCHGKYGAGMVLVSSTSRLDTVRVYGNRASAFAGGLYALNGGALEIVNCSFRSNRASTAAGGIVLQQINGVAIGSNTVLQGNGSDGVGGAMYSVQCEGIRIHRGCVIEENEAQSVGGVYCALCDDARIEGVRVVSNKAAEVSGVFLSGCGEFEVIDCDFIGNVATAGSAGGVYVVQSRGRVRTDQGPGRWVDNKTTGGGGMLVVDGGSYVELHAPEVPLIVASNLGASCGGALWVLARSTATVVGAVHFIGNTSVWGGAIFATNHAVVTLLSTNGHAPLFWGNAANLNGGAICLMATSRLTAVNCVFRENVAGADGGAIANVQSMVDVQPAHGEAQGRIPTIFANNRASYGGAIHCNGSRVTSLDSALLMSNTTTFSGGALRLINASHAELVNCVLARNAAQPGGAVSVSSTSSVRLRHCTVVGNRYGVKSEGGLLVLSNCIVRGNTDGQVTPGYTVRYSNIEGGYVGVGNIDADALFVNAEQGDYALGYSSPCVDAGAAAGVTWDCVGKPRPLGLGYDMGAYEQDPAPVQVLHPTVLDFGDVVVGDSAQLPVNVANVGNSILTGAVNFVPVPIFTVNPASYVIAPQVTTNVVVTFSPPMEYRWTQAVVFASNGGSTNVTLIGTGIPEPLAAGVIGVIAVLAGVGLRGRKLTVNRQEKRVGFIRFWARGARS